MLCHYHLAIPVALSTSAFDHIALAPDRLIPVVGRETHEQPLHRLPGTRKEPVPHLAFEHSPGMGRILSADLLARDRDLHLSPVLSSHLAMVLKALAAARKGIAWVPQSLARNKLGSTGRLASGRPREWKWDIDVRVALFRSGARMCDPAERFWDLLREALKAFPFSLTHNLQRVSASSILCAPNCSALVSSGAASGGYQ